MSFRSQLAVFVPLLLALSVPAHAQIEITAPDNGGLANGTWFQDGTGFGRITGDLHGGAGPVLYLMKATLLPSLDHPATIGTVQGNLLPNDGTDPLFIDSDLYMLGTWSRRPDRVEFDCLIFCMQRQTGVRTIVGRLNGLADSWAAETIHALRPAPANDSAPLAADTIPLPLTDPRLDARWNGTWQIRYGPSADTGAIAGTWSQMLDNSGRVVGRLQDVTGSLPSLMLLDIISDPNGPEQETATQSSGSLFGFLYDISLPDPWKQPSDVVVLGSWERSFDTGSFEALVFDRGVQGSGLHIGLLGRIQGTFGPDDQAIIFPTASIDQVSQSSGPVLFVAAIVGQWHSF